MSSRRYNSSVRRFEEIPIIVVEPPPMEPKSANVDETALTVENKDSDYEDSEYLPDPTKIGLALRRNSISLPNLDDLKVFKQHVQIAEPEDGDDSDSDFEFPPSSRTPLRNVRRKSVISPRMLKPPGDDESGSNSPANSITSVNSLASLLREKMQMLPATLRNKKSPDYKIRIFVCILFITIVVLICCAYFLYHQKILHKAYFERIKFNKINRVMKIYNNEGMELIRARLGTTINYNQALPCLPSDERGDGSICSEWMDRARLYLQFYELNSEVKCYNLHWISLNEAIEPTDCIDLSQGNDHWYGGGQTAESAWPLEKGDHDFSPFITGRVDKHEYGNVLKRYFISSKGVALIVDDTTPLYVSIMGVDNKELCLRAKYDDFAYVNRIMKTAQLNYSICTSSDMTKLHSNLLDNALWDGLKPDDMTVVNSLLTEPLWEITSTSKSELTEETITNYTENVIALGFLKQGHVLINEFWQKHVGDFEVDSERFPTLKDAIIIMHRRGFRIVFSIQPFISTESFNFAEAVKKRLFISERFSDRRIPALTRYKYLQSAGALDATNNGTIPWLLNKLKTVLAKYNVDAYYLDLGTAYNMPHYYQCERPLINPDQYKTLLINSLQSTVTLFGVNSAIERPRTPTFVSLPQFESSWDGLRRVIPTILTYGVLGYPFLIPGAVGGDFEAAESYLQVTNYTSELLPDKELYVRWLQLATFLPVIRYTHLPSTYGDEKVMAMARILTTLRQAKVTPLLKKYAKSSMDTGLPLIRPLWMLEYNDTACHVVADEFSIGEDLIVAPVLYSGAREREIYLPAGVWKDGIDGSLRKGSRWIHDYKVEDDKVAYFEKMPDDTRF